MIIAVIGIIIGICGLAYAWYAKAQCVQLDRKIEEQNAQLYLENLANQKLKKEISQELKELSEKRSFQTEQLNQLLQQKQIVNAEIEIKQAQMETLTQNIDSLSSSQKEAARAAFEQYCDTLDFEYKEKEREFDVCIENLDNLYNKRHDSFLREMARNEQELNRKREECERDLDIIRSELAKIKSSRAAAIEAQLREQEIKNKATFYTLQLNEADRRDVAYLKSIEFNLREARPLRMLIWSTFYRDKLNDLAARVGAVGACGIYKITHAESGISYIGQAKDIKTRWSDHVKCALGIDTPVTSQLYAFMREKGVDAFTFEILEKCSTAELNEKEKFYIDLYQTYDYGLNGNRGVGK